jgi:bifunctional non-homologous end joining protein LigD
VLDGELAATDELGRTVFEALMHPSQPMRYFTFDLVWLNGRDLRSMPLLARKRQLKQLLPARSAHMLYVDHIKGSGIELYQLACQLDLEGIVAKRAASQYDHNANGDWIKIKNPNYSQKDGRGDLFKRTG